MMLKKLTRMILDKKYRREVFLWRGVYCFLKDEKYVKLFYETISGKKLNLDAPQTFNEKLQWLKINDRKPEYTQMVDKLAAKSYVAERIGDEHIIPTLGFWERAEDIDFDTLPKQFVLKCTHDSGGLIICKDKSKLDLEGVRIKLKKSLKRNFYKYGREWPYKDVPRRILAEQYMYDSEGDKDNLTDYKIFCFDGEPVYVMTVRDRGLGKGKALHRWYTKDWVLQDLDLDYRNEVKQPEPRPVQLNQMLDYARLLSAGIKHLRVDFYIINGQIYFGELTFYHMSGVERFEPEKWDRILGELIVLDKEE